MSNDLLAHIWFILLGVLLVGYAVLDGFDLGVGILHLTARGDRERRVLMNAIGPLWDGNEVWLVTFGGAMFAAFPNAYATIFSGLYVAFMLLLFALIFRAVSLEFRGKARSPLWRRIWDFFFFLGSLSASFLFGVAVGNGMAGIPIDEHMNFTGSVLDLLGPYPLLVGLFTVAMFAMHGSIFLYLKTEGQLQERIHHWMLRSFGIFLLLYVLTTIFTLTAIPTATRNFDEHPWAWIVVVLSVLAIANIPRAIFLERPGYAFISSCCTIAAFIFLFSIALYPNLVTSSSDPALSLTIQNAASSQRTLTIMLIIAAIGMPCVLAYTAVIYWTFRGKVQISEASY